MMVFSELPSNRLPAAFASAVNRFLKLDELEQFYERSRSEKPLAGEMLRELGVRVQVSERDIARIPKKGAVIAVSNHPFGLLDGVILTDLLTKIRSDVRILTNGMLGQVAELARICIFVDPFDRPENKTANGRALRAALTHVKKGGMLLIFPAGEVSHFDPKGGAIRDPEWRETAARLVRMTRARVVPIFVRGSNSLPFQMLGMVHPRLRTAALAGEFLNKRGQSVEVRIGSEIEPARVEAFATDAEAIGYLRRRSEWLSRRGEREQAGPARSTEVAAPESAEDLAREVAQLPSLCRMANVGNLEVYAAEAQQIPGILREIGRLREVTFRDVGEGTGRARDLDSFDAYYLHIFVWHRERQEVVGAYRVGDVPRILVRYGLEGLYTNTQFRFDSGFFRRLGPALELGRSFVRAEYQKQFMPLALLWRGICCWVARRPEYSTLIGAVSVSGQYSRSSRELIAAWFEGGRSTGETGIVKPRRPLRGRWARGAMPAGIEELSEWVSDVETDGKGLPILVKQYAKLGGRILAFSVDPDFGNTLDGFVMLDLRQAPAESLVRHMGKDGAATFFAWHRIAAQTAA